MADHAKLSPSAADRWMTCPGSVPLSAGIENKSSAFADEGTRAHKAAEELLLIGAPQDPISVEMMEHVLVYVEHVEDLGDEDPDAEIEIEKRVAINDQVWGTADALIWHPSTKTLYCRDLKYGAGVAVEVHGNLQLKIYALAALLTSGYKADTVDVGIVQPRCPHSDGPIRSVRFDAVDLIDFHADVLAAAERVRQAVEHKQVHGTLLGKHFEASEKGCRWCLAAAKCPKIRNKAQELAKHVFAPAPADDRRAAPSPFDVKQLAETLDWLPILEGWIKNVRETAYGEAEKGHPVPGYKLVEKRATRKWKDEASAVLWLQQLGVQPFEAPSLISPAVAEKALAKDERPGLAALCLAESSGHTLVHESDKRPAIRVDAKAAFG